jgi:hypothetical protein
MIHIFLPFGRRAELTLRNTQGMIATLDGMQKISGFHLRSDAPQKIQRTQRVTRALHKQDGRSQRAQNLIAEFCAIAHGAERISKANQAVHIFLQRQVTPNPAAHALPD